MFVMSSSSRAMALAAASSALLGAGLLLHERRACVGNPGFRRSDLPAGCSIQGTIRASPLGRLVSGRLAFAESGSSRLVVEASSPASQAEPNTGIEFSKRKKLPGASKDLSLLGVGVREKKIAFISVKVYAVGFYVDQEQLAKDVSASEILSQNPREYWIKHLAGPFEKGLEIVLARDVDGALFSSALDEELKPRMMGDQVLSEFGNLFKNRSLRKGTSVYFTWVQPSTLHVAISDDGSTPSAPISSFESGPLASALFDVYLGEKPVAPSLKSSLAESLKQLV